MSIEMDERSVLSAGDPRISELRSTDLADATLQRLADDGYLLVRKLHDRDLVMDARRALLEQMAAAGRLRPGAPVIEGVAKTAGPPPPGATKLSEFRAVVAGPGIMDFFERLLGGPALTYDFKWLRFTPPGGHSGVHCDRVFMGRGTDRLYTCWTPFGDIPAELGPLALYLDSDRQDLINSTYAEQDVDIDLVAGYVAEDPFELVETCGGRWATAEFSAGDVLIFGPYMVHSSLVNATDRFRVTSDTRYQLLSEPVDGRWVGESPVGHYAWMKGPDLESIEAGRARWGIPIRR